MGKHAEFSIRRDLNQENWARSVLETCKSVGIFGLPRNHQDFT